jgi:thiamine monophosphate synthase
LKRFLSHTGHTVVALGGLNTRRVATAASLGFRGIAVIGAVWGAADPQQAAGRLSAACRGLSPAIL